MVLAGPLSVNPPLGPDRAQQFDDLVVSLVERLAGQWEDELRGVEFGTEDVPQIPEGWTAEPAPLGLLVRARAREPTRIVLFRRPIELRAPTRLERAALVREVLVDTVHAAAVVVGEGFRFGHRAAGDVPLLASLGGAHGFTVEGVPLLTDAHHPISSTWVRERVAEGDVAAAADALGRPHRVEGTVVRGDRRGRELGYPTANVAVDPGSAVPLDGVYAGWLVVAGGSLPAAISLGTNPTFGGVERRVEAYALDRDDLDLYDARVAVDFAARLRDTERFDSVDALIAEMAHDVAQTRKWTAS